MPVYDLKNISKEALDIYNEELLKMRNNKTNQILKALREYKYIKPKLNFNNIKDFDLEIKMINNVENYYFKKKNKDNDTVVLVLHGGGYVLPVSQNNVHGATLYSKYINDSDVLLPDYKVAGIGSHMDALNNAYNSYLYLKDKYKNIILAGQSAGGNLALGLLEYLKDNNVELPKCVILASPWTDYKCEGESYKFNMHNDILFGSDDGGILPDPYNKIYDKYMFPLEFDIKNYPPIMINVAKTEMLLSDSLSLYDKLDKDKSEIYLYPYMWHDFYTHDDELKECNDCWNRINKFVKKYL